MEMTPLVFGGIDKLILPVTLSTTHFEPTFLELNVILLDGYCPPHQEHVFEPLFHMLHGIL